MIKEEPEGLSVKKGEIRRWWGGGVRGGGGVSGGSGGDGEGISKHGRHVFSHLAHAATARPL